MLASFILAWGDDTFQLQAAEKHLCDTLVDPGFAAMNLTVLDGAVAPLAEALGAARTFPFGPGARVVVVRDCSYFPQAPTAGNEPNEDWQYLLDVLREGLPPTCHLIFVVPRGIAAVAKFLKEQAPTVDTRGFQLPQSFQDKGDMTWLTEQVRNMGLAMDPDLVAAFFRRVGPDRHRQVNELKKLRTYAGGARLTRELMGAIVSAQDPDVFAVLDAIGSRDAAVAVLQLRRLLATEPALKILAAMSTMVRRVLQYKVLSDKGLNVDAIARELKVKPGGVGMQLRKYPGWTTHEFTRAVELLLETDVALKTGSGRAREALLLESLIVRLATRA